MKFKIAGAHCSKNVVILVNLCCPLQIFSPNWSHNAQNVSICVHRTFWHVTKPYWIKFKIAGANCGKKYSDFGGFMVSGANFFSQFGPMMPKMCQSVSTEHFGMSQSHIGSNSRSQGPIVVKNMVILVDFAYP
jgi:hypothetical protein